MSNLNLQQMKNRDSEERKNYKLSLNLHCIFPIFFIFKKFVKDTGMTINDLEQLFFSGLSSVGFKTNYFNIKNPMVIRETPVKSSCPST
jgi:hypothetical protein